MVKRKRLCNSARLQVMYNADYKCYDCKCVLPPTCEIDHIIPLHHSTWKDMPSIIAYNKANAYQNLCPLCPNCHAAKTRQERMARFRLQWDKDKKLDYTCHICKKTWSKYFKPSCKCV